MTTSSPRVNTWLQKGINWGLLILVSLMPFHAFMSVWLGSLTGQQIIVQSWKEVFTVLLSIGTAYLVWREPQRIKRASKPIIFFALGFAIFALLSTLANPQSINAILYGIKTDFEFIALFFVALWGSSQQLLRRLPIVILITSGLVASFAIIHATILPADFLVQFGYGLDTIEPYQGVGSLSDTIRTPSTLGGPNQLGSFMILPLVLALSMFIKRPSWILALSGVLSLSAIWYSYSRSAWIGAIVAVGVTLAACLRTKNQFKLLAIGATSFLAIMTVLLIFSSQFRGPFDYFILHSGSGIEQNNSTTQHADALDEGLQSVATNPFGLGLGSAGPASFQSSNGLIPENYYLQLAIETSLAGLLFFALFIVFVGYKMWQIRHKSILAPALIGALVGISLINIVLHGWADSSTAFVFWVTAGATIAGASKNV